MKCFYYNDLDGVCGAYWIERYCQGADIETTPDDFQKINNGQSVPIDIISDEEMIFIIGCYIEPHDMMKLLQITKNIIWIHHHISLDIMYENCNIHIPGIRTDQKISTCLLAYIFMKGFLNISDEKSWSRTFIRMLDDGIIKQHAGNNYPELFIDENVMNNYDYLSNLCLFYSPKFTRLISDYNTGKNLQYKDSKYFYLSLSSKSLSNDPLNSGWHELENFPSITEDMIDIGECMDEYKTHFESAYTSSVGFDATMVYDGTIYKCKVINLGSYDESIFNSIDNKSDYDIFIIFSYIGNDKKYHYTLYSDKVDIHKIAVSYGGNGYVGGPAIFSSANNIFENDPVII